MRKRIAQALVLCMMTCVMFTTSSNHRVASEQIPVIEEVAVAELLEVPTIEKHDVPHVAMPAKTEKVALEVREKIQEEEPRLSQEDIDLLAVVTMGEAEGETEMGKRLVIDTILNRMDSEEFPDTVSCVIYQKNAFECMWNGRINECYVLDDIRQLVLEELESRTNSRVMYFRTKRFSDYGEPMFKEGRHYFSSM